MPILMDSLLYIQQQLLSEIGVSHLIMPLAKDNVGVESVLRFGTGMGIFHNPVFRSLFPVAMSC